MSSYSERGGDARDAKDANQTWTRLYTCVLRMQITNFCMWVIITLNLEYTTGNAQREAVQTSIHTLRTFRQSADCKHPAWWTFTIPWDCDDAVWSLWLAKFCLNSLFIVRYEPGWTYFSVTMKAHYRRVTNVVVYIWITPWQLIVGKIQPLRRHLTIPPYCQASNNMT